MSIFRQKGRENNAKVFLNDFKNLENSYFISVGNAVTSPVVPILPTNDTIEADQYAWDNMFFMNQIFDSDVSLMIKENVWTANTRYEAFDKSKNQYDTNEIFYALNTSNSCVYLCMASPDNKNILSTFPPTSQGLQLEEKPDGYTWKFLYKILEEDAEKFNYPGYIPIKEVGTDLYTDDRVLQQNVEASSVRGAIEGITVVNQGNAYTAAANVEFLNPAYGVTFVNSTTVSTSTALPEIIKTEDYYKDNYVINFENGFTAVIDRSYVHQASNTFRIEICADLIFSPDGSTEIPIGEQFRIVPRIKISGNGSGSWAIPILNADKKLTNVRVLSGGTNYSYVDTSFFVENGSIVRAIIGLNGLASDITQILGAKHIMVSKKIKPETSLSQGDPVLYSLPQNAGVVYNGTQYEGVISEGTYYTQIAIIKNPKSTLAEFQAIGASSVEVREMVIEAINPKVIIHIGTSGTPYINSDNFFEIGDILVRGPDNYQDQFRAVITDITTTATTTVLTCNLISGAFETYAGYRIKNLKNTTEIGDDAFFVFQDCQSNCSKSIFATYENTFQTDDFTTEVALFGSTSLQSVEIVPPPAGYSYVNPLYPNRAKIKVKNASSNFIFARYEDGEYLSGEVVTGLVSVGTETLPTKTGTLASVSAPLTTTENSVGYCYILQCTINRDGIDTPYELVNTDRISLETNTMIRQGTTGTVGKIIRTALPSGTDGGNTVYLYVNNYNGAFQENAETIYAINDLYDPTSYTDMKMSVSRVVYVPNLVRYSGNLLYINDVGPVQRRLENSETVKILIEF